MSKSDKENNSLSILDELNDEQRNAVKDFNFPLLILAEPGAGKTTVLIKKIIYIMKIKKISPKNILALTFNRKAADEMRQRISERNSEQLEMGTFHFIFSKILRRHISVLSYLYNSNYNIIKEKEVNKIIKNIIKTKQNDIKFTNPSELEILATRFTKKMLKIKSEGKTYEEYNKLAKEIENDKERGLENFNKIYELYEKECQEKNIMDFEDILLNTLSLFEKDKNILKSYQKQFEYIFIDEYQDTNRLQFQILEKLSPEFKNICAIGDDYQSIYSFRGATLSNIDDFIKFPNAKKLILHQNYRSNSNIVKVSNQLIKHNQQPPKDLFSQKNGTDGKVTIIRNKTGFDETKTISNIIKGLIDNKKCEFKDIAILYRINIQCLPFQKMFFKKNIPYNINNKNNFYKTRVIKKIYAYLKFFTKPKSNYYLKKIINFPKRYINEEEKDFIFNLSESRNISCWEIINSSDDREKMRSFRIRRRLRKKLKHLKKKLLNIISNFKNKGVYDTVNELINCLHLKKYLENKSSEKMDKLLDKISELEEEYTNLGIERYTLKEFLEQMKLFIEDKDSRENKNQVKLMTIHQAKGLEFKYVFVVGLEKGFYPLSEREDKIEEERRILYVALTRAEVKCYISYSDERILGTEKVKRQESIFINEINDKELVDIYKSQTYEENKEEKNIIINNNVSEKNEKELINKEENKIVVGINNTNYENNNENRINFNEEPNSNCNNLNCGQNKNIQKEEEINNLNNLIRKEKSDSQENEKNNKDNLNRFKFLNKKRNLEK